MEVVANRRRNKMAPKNSSKNIDDYIGCGCYQVINFIFMNFINCLNAFNMTMMVFGKVEPEWVCFDEETDQELWNLTEQKTYNCEQLSNVSCKNFSMIYDFRSVVIDFDLTCAGMKLVYLAISIQMIGVLVGSPVFGQMSDWFGRKWVLFSATLFQIITGIGSAWSPDIKIFTLLRFFVGIFTGGTVVTSQTYFVEFLTAKHRFWVNAASSWSIGYALLAVLAWWTAEWRTFTIYGNLVGIPGLIMLCFLKESPRWLLQKGKHIAAEESIGFVTKINKSSADLKKMETLFAQNGLEKMNGTKRKHYSFWHLFMTRLLRNHTLVMCFCYYAISTITYGIMFGTSGLVGNRYLNFALFAVIRYMVSFVGIFVDAVIRPCGRKLMFCSSFGVEFGCCVTLTVLMIYGLNKTVAFSSVAILGGVMTAPIWNALSTSASEIFPTPIRNVGNGCNAVFNRLGAVVAPQILYLGTLWAPSTYIIFASLAAGAIILNIIFIPETKGKPLPEYMPVRDTSSRRSSEKSSKSSTMRSDSFTMYTFREPNRYSVVVQ